MKKGLFLSAIACLSLFAANAQLAGTKWQGMVGLPTQGGKLAPIMSTWSFQKDTLTITYASEALIPDVMTFSEEKSIISIQKIGGGVPCDASEVGKFSYEIKSDQLLITKIEDACKVRGAVDISQPLTRVK